MIEAVVSVALLAIGIVSVLGAYAGLTTQQTKANATEQMQRYALDKYDELVATQSLQTESLNGDFSDRGDDSYTWTADIEPTGIQDLSSLTVTVQPQSGPDGSMEATASGLIYIPPQTSTTPAGGTP